MTQSLLDQTTNEIEADILAYGEFIDNEDRANHWIKRTAEVMDAYRAMPANSSKQARTNCFNRALQCGASLEKVSYITKIPMGVCVRFAKEFSGMRLSQQREVYDFEIVKETARIRKLVRRETQEAILEYPDLWELQQTYNEALYERRSILSDPRHSNRRKAGADELADAKQQLHSWIAYDFLGDPTIDKMVEHADEMHKAMLSGKEFNPFTGEYEPEEPPVEINVIDEGEDKDPPYREEDFLPDPRFGKYTRNSRK